MKNFFILLAFLCFFSSVSRAQSSVEYKTAVQKMLMASGSENTFKAAVGQMFTLMKQQKSSVPEEFWKTLETEMTKTSMPDLIALLVPIYQKHFTVDDINQLTAFYQSPIGKKFAEKTPLITQESMAAGQQWGMKIGQKIVEKIKEKYN